MSGQDVVIVAGAVAAKPDNGGEAWVRLSWARGLQRLGFDVYLVEHVHRAADEAAAPYFDAVVAAAGMAERAALVSPDGDSSRRIAFDELLAIVGEAALVVNVSGNLRAPSLLRRARRTAYVDLDPGFTQIWHANGTSGADVSGHDVYFTIAANIGSADCSIPTAGIEWRVTRQPVVLDDWPVTPAADGAPFTTVARWRPPYGRVEWRGRRYGVKLDEFRKVLPLPARCAATFELALDIDPAERTDLEALDAHGWHRVDPRRVAGDPDGYRRYVQASAAEFSPAQGIYVETNSGWFSDRSVRYLAAGKPVVVQDTGFGTFLPAGRGVVPYATLDDAAAAVDAVLADYDAHARDARDLAETYFDSDRVLRRFLADALA